MDDFDTELRNIFWELFIRFGRGRITDLWVDLDVPGMMLESMVADAYVELDKIINHIRYYRLTDKAIAFISEDNHG